MYCKVQETQKFFRPKLTCIHPSIKKEWVTGEAFFGELKEGVSFKIPVAVAREFASKEPRLLQILKGYFTFEIIIGVNGMFFHKNYQVPG